MSSFSDALAVVNQYLGTPYVWGGNGPAGVDCSGFTRAVYDAMGIDLPRVSNQQANAGTLISQDEAQPGDLVSWDLNGRNVGADHVGVYLGNGKVAEASSSSGQVVIRNLWGNAQFHRFNGIEERMATGTPQAVTGQPAPRAPGGPARVNALGSQDNNAAFGSLSAYFDEDDLRGLQEIYAKVDDNDPGEREDTVGPYNVARLTVQRPTLQSRGIDPAPQAPQAPMTPGQRRQLEM